MASVTQPVITLVAIDDESNVLRLISSTLAQEGLEILTETDPERGLDLVLRRRPEIVLLDLVMPKMGGMELLQRIIEADPSTDVIFLTGHYTTESAVEAIHKGACDYINKPFSTERLRQRVDQLVAQARQRRRGMELEGELLDAARFEGMVGRSPLMLEVFALILRVVPHFRTVLVTGATGTGKELVARALHRLSQAASGRFVVANCSAIVETLFESELFGYVKGAFTGATQDKIGMVEYAHGGVLFLDEIGEMPLTTQAKLLRVLQTQEVQRVGSPAVRKVEVRVIAATHQELRAMVAAKRFREDLYYRLSMLEIKLPPLVERKEDLPILERHFVEQFAKQYNKPIRGLTRRAQGVLARHNWPGNVRELENVLGRACLLAQGGLVDVGDLPSYLWAQPPQEMAEEETLLPLSEMEYRYAQRVVERVGGNKVRAAEILGISRATLYRLLASGDSSAEGDQ